MGQELLLATLPFCVDSVEHAHGLHHVRVAQRCIGKLLRPCGTAIGLIQGLSGGSLVHVGHTHLGYRTYQGRPTQ